jgi:serine/threonine-protein kinase
VKPANVLLDPAGHVVVSDFGIARRHGATSVTGSGVLLGTASYMSPEQCLGRRAEAAADQYALGVVAFELLAGRRPFVGRSSDVIRAHLTESPPRLSELRPDVPPEIDSFVMRMLEKDPAARHSSLRAAERLFRRFVVDESATTTQLKHVSLAKPMEASRAGTAGLEQVAPVAPVASVGERSSRGTPRTIGLVAAGVGAVALLAAGAIMLRPLPSVPPRSEHAATPSTTVPGEPSMKKTTPVADRPAVRPTRTPEPTKQAMEAQQVVGIEKTITSVADSAVRADTSVAVIRPQGETQSKALPAASVAASTAATAADARAAASEFLTWCNHRQWQDVERLASLDSSPDLRTQLINLIRKAPDFQAGFERLASRPVSSDTAFTTDFILDLEWRGGARQFEVTIRAELSNGTWHVAGFGVRQPD